MIKQRGFWYVTAANRAHLVVSYCRAASAVKFGKLFPGVPFLYSAPAEICPECNHYKTPIDRDVQKLSFPDAEPCKCGYQHVERYLPGCLDAINSPLQDAQIN